MRNLTVLIPHVNNFFILCKTVSKALTLKTLGLELVFYHLRFDKPQAPTPGSASLIHCLLYTYKNNITLEIGVIDK